MGDGKVPKWRIKDDPITVYPYNTVFQMHWRANEPKPRCDPRFEFKWMTIVKKENMEMIEVTSYWNDAEHYGSTSFYKDYNYRIWQMELYQRKATQSTEWLQYLSK